MLRGAGIDVLEAALRGYVSARDLCLAAPGPGETVALLDEENTPVAIARVDAAGDSLSEIKPDRPLAPLHGAAGDVRSRLDAHDLRDRLARGALAVICEGLPSNAELDQIRKIAEPGRLLLWCVTSSRALGQIDPAMSIARAISALIAAGEIGGELVVIPALTGEPATLELRDGGVTLRDLLPRLGATEVVVVGARLESELARVAPRAVLDEFARARSRQAGRGGVVLFTGLSGSGKSTVAKAFAAHVEERSGIPAVLIDGDEARQLLSSGLGFDRAARDLNVERLGYVAALIASVGGLAILAPIAPFAAARQKVRERALQVGAYVLVHVSTPLEVCEERDRKGLYARARAGEIPDFTGISSPYETPTDADVVIDTSRLTVADAVAKVWDSVDAALGDATRP